MDAERVGGVPTLSQLGGAASATSALVDASNVAAQAAAWRTALAVDPAVTELDLDAHFHHQSPSGAVAGSIGVFQTASLADSGNQAAGWNVALPAGWTTYDLKIEHIVNPTAAAPNNVVSLRVDTQFLSDGGDTTAVTSSAIIPVTIGATNTLKLTTLLTGLPITAGKLLSLRIIRISADAADTFTGSFHIRVARLLKAS